MSELHEITHLLAAAGRGEPEAEQRLLVSVQDKLRRLAAARLARVPVGNTLQPTALVNEAWLRLASKLPEPDMDRARFFASAARAMRDILVEQARRKGTEKRGGDRRRQDLSLNEPALSGSPASLLDIHEALLELEREDPHSAELVNLRFFAGLSTEETAAILGVSSRTVKAHWQFARRWLFRRLGGAA